MIYSKKIFFTLILFTASFLQVNADPLPANASTLILQKLKRLNVLSRVLYIAAHPDDENNCLNAYLTNELMTDVAYLSITRGDGGQNLIGPEQQDGLAVLRTEESEASHRIDGARTFYTRAKDFGFSKTVQEALKIWGKESVLYDIVWIIRQYRPDIIITRFNESAPENHGQHIAAAILAREAFTAAADPHRFPDQLKYTTVWQAKRLLWNVYEQFSVKGAEGEINSDNYIAVNVGKYNPLLGTSYGEIAVQSRMLHRSQGMGIGIETKPGQQMEYFKHIAGSEATVNLFEGIDQSWSRIELNNISTLINQAINKFDFYNPPVILPELIAILKLIDKEEDHAWVLQKREELLHIVHSILGLSMEVTANAAFFNPGEKTVIQTKILNRSDVPIELTNIYYGFAGKDTSLSVVLKDCNGYQFATNITLSNDLAYTQPGWLTDTWFNDSTYLVASLALPKSQRKNNASFSFKIYDYIVTFTTLFQYRQVSPETGGQLKNVIIAPKVLVDIAEPVYCFASSGAKKIKVSVKATENHVTGLVKLNIPDGWSVKPAAQKFSIEKKSGEQFVFFSLTPPHKQCVGEILAEATVNDDIYNQGYRCISYPHINDQYYFPTTKSKISKIDLKTSVHKIAYLKGAADLIEVSIREAGLDVTTISERDINSQTLKKFDALVIGIRAYNILPGLDSYKKVLTDYINEGGNIVALYNTCYDLATKDIGLFPFELSSDRITDEQAEAVFLNPSHRVLNYPNKITQDDFNGWVIERGSYFPKNWSKQYEAVLSFNDPGENPLNGSLLVAKYGKGYFTYTSLSFFRQLPAGIPGAYRLFSNILSLSTPYDKKFGTQSRKANAHMHNE